MNTINCERARELAGRTELSGQVLAARYHVHRCPYCQRMLSELWTQVAVLDDRIALQKLLGIDLSEAICQQTERVITWLTRSTRQVLAVAIRLSEPAAPLVLSPRLATAGTGTPSDMAQPRVIRQEVKQTPDGSLAWKITFIVDSADPNYCVAEVEAKMDRWDLSGIDVYLNWNSHQRHGQTDKHGRVRFANIPVDALGQINVIIYPSHLPTSINGAQ